MDELTLDDKKYLSSKKAAKMTGYAKDYVGQLCREGRVDARLVGRNWYVLESSILEHRFGAEETEITPVVAPSSDVRAWEAPRYVSESITTVPELAPKPSRAVVEASLAATEENKQVLSDMQSAWQEWFQTQEKAEKTLPDASEMLLEANYEDEPVAPTVELLEAEEVAEEPVFISRVTEPAEAFEAPGEAEETIAIHRVHEVVVPSSIEQPFYEAVPVSRSYAPANRAVPPVPTQYQRVRRAQAPRKPRNNRSSSRVFALRALLLAVAGLAIAVTFIGTGFADNVVHTGGFASSFASLISGVQTISK